MSAGKTVALIFAICAGAGLALLAICGGFFYLSYKNAESTASPRVDALFTAIDNNRFADTYETETTRELRAAQSKEQYVALGEMIREKLGAMKSKSITGFKVGKHNADSTIEASYNATFEKGQGTVTVHLKKEDGQWKLLGFNVSSPLLKGTSASEPAADAPHPQNAGEFTHRWPDGGSAGRQWRPGNQNQPLGFDTQDDKYEMSHTDPDNKTTTSIEYQWRFLDHKDGKDIYSLTRRVSVTEHGDADKTEPQSTKTITVEYAGEPITLFDDELGRATLAPIE